MTMFKKPLFYTVISCLLISWCSLWTNNTNNENTPQPNNENGITKESENSPEQNIEIKDNVETKEENQDKQINGFVEYENKKFNFKIEIPSNRTFQEDSQWFNLILNTPKNDDINENLWIVVQELQVEETLESFTEKTIEWLKELYEDYNEIKKENIEINSNKWITLTYEISENWYKIKAQQTTFLKDNKSYVFQYTAIKDTFDNYINEITEIINSFTLLN